MEMSLIQLVVGQLGHGGWHAVIQDHSVLEKKYRDGICHTTLSGLTNT